MTSRDRTGGDDARTVVLFDLSTLRFRRRGGVLSVLSATGEELACCDAEGLDDRQAVAAALEDATGRGVVWRDGVPCQVGLYHPGTAQVALGAWPRGRILGAGAPVVLDPGGTPAVECGAGLELADGTVLCEQPPLELTALSRLIA